MVNGVSTLPAPSHSAAQPIVAHRGDAVRLPLGDGFIAGSENRLLAAVIENWRELLADESIDQTAPAWQRLASPLVLVGPTGRGKTHLAAGLAELAGPRRAVYTTASDLRRELAEAIDRHQAGDWRERLASVPLLVVEGLDRVPTSRSFQWELLHLAESLAAAGHKLLVTARRPLAHQVGWLPDLVSWFASGLTLEIAPLQVASRRELLRQHADRHRWQFTPEAFDYLATHVSAEPRELLQLVDEMQRQFGPRASFALDTLQHFLKKRKAAHAPRLGEIVRVVARYYQLPQKQLTSASRKAEVVAARATAIYLARNLTSASYEEIGRLFGGRDHSTVMHNYRRTADRLTREPALQSAMEELTRILRR